MIMKSFVYARIEKQKRARARKADPTSRIAGTNVFGCTKSGWTPGGGSAPGRMSNKPGGKLSTNCGLTLEDIVATDYHEKKVDRKQ